jgi:hypothetical protein
MCEVERHLVPYPEVTIINILVYIFLNFKNAYTSSLWYCRHLACEKKNLSKYVLGNLTLSKRYIVPLPTDEHESQKF